MPIWTTQRQRAILSQLAGTATTTHNYKLRWFVDKLKRILPMSQHGDML